MLKIYLSNLKIYKKKSSYQNNIYKYILTQCIKVKMLKSHIFTARTTSLIKHDKKKRYQYSLSSQFYNLNWIFFKNTFLKTKIDQEIIMIFY